MIILVEVIILLTLFIILYLHTPKFGRLPGNKRKKKITASPNFRDGQFQNVNHTPSLTEGVSFSEVLFNFLFKEHPGKIPLKPLPAIRTDLKNLKHDENVLIWFGHSSYFFRLDGKNFLVDPVLCGSASPLPFGTKAFKGTNNYRWQDLPEIDCLFITHDHWDHLDHETVKAIRPQVGKVVCGLGVGEHLERWGYDEGMIIEKDWNESFELYRGFNIDTVPARHFSGRGLTRNQTLWMSFVLKTPSKKIFIGGDSGYDTHFARIGERFGPFDLAILENGQYDANWRYIHMLPDEILKAAKELRANQLLPVHSGKFSLSNHTWQEPFEMIVKNNETVNMTLLTPKIGERVELNSEEQVFSKWWMEV